MDALEHVAEAERLLEMAAQPGGDIRLKANQIARASAHTELARLRFEMAPPALTPGRDGY